MKVLSCRSAKEMWVTLEEMYANKESLVEEEFIKTSAHVKETCCMTKVFLKL